MVTSSLAEGAELAGLVGWTAAVTLHGVVQVRRVEFVVDDQVRWTQTSPAPYRFSGDGRLAAWVLGPGEHELVVRVLPNPGRAVEAVSHVTVAERPTGSARVAGTYARDVKEAARFGLQSGRWVLHVTADGLLQLVAPNGASVGEPYSAPDPSARQSGTVRVYGAAAWLRVRPQPALQLCPPGAAGGYGWTKIGVVLEVTAQGSGCAGRDAVLVGSWTEVT